MVCIFMKDGNRVKLLLLPTAESGEELSCGHCNEIFNNTNNHRRRCVYVSCDHISCFGCVMQSKTGCLQCHPPSESPSPTTSEEEESEEEYESGNKPELPQTPKGRRRRRQIVSSSGWNAKALPAGAVHGKWNCSYCHEPCTDKSTLGLHMRKMHSKKRPYNCDMCDWCLINTTQLESHRKAHFKDMPHSHQCPFCSITFPRKFETARHVVSKHSDCVGILPLGGGKCQSCQAVFGRRRFSARRKTMYTRCGHIFCLDCVVKSLNGCTLCTPLVQKNQQTKISETTTAEERHYLDTSVNETVVAPQEENCASEDDEEEKTNLFKCILCKMYLTTPYNLNRHILRFHQAVVTVAEPSERNPICTSCNHYFETVVNSKRRKVSYVQCGHSICMGCVIQEKFRCNQCQCPPLQPSFDDEGCYHQEVDQLQNEQTNDKTEYSAYENEQVEEDIPNLDNGLSYEGGGSRFVCRLCDFTLGTASALEQHLRKMHAVHLIKPRDHHDSPNGKEEESRVHYCPECQDEFGSTPENQKAVYSSCGHLSCLSCIWRAELGCGQCTTINALRLRARRPSPSMSPTKCEMTFRKLWSTLHDGGIRSVSMPSSASPRNFTAISEPTSFDNKMSTVNNEILIAEF